MCKLCLKTLLVTSVSGIPPLSSKTTPSPRSEIVFKVGWRRGRNCLQPAGQDWARLVPNTGRGRLKKIGYCRPLHHWYFLFTSVDTREGWCKQVSACSSSGNSPEYITQLLSNWLLHRSFLDIWTLEISKDISMKQYFSKLTIKQLWSHLLIWYYWCVFANK